MSKILGKEYPISKIFSSDFDYYIPAYQRPYAWTEEEAGTLFDDLYDFYQTQQNDSYFLGSIVLIKQEDAPRAEVIDGQQRLTTLTILLAVISANLVGDARQDCEGFLREKGNLITGVEPKPRLHIRRLDQEFFEKYIQNVDLEALLALDTNRLTTEAQRHIRLNCEIVMNRVKNVFHADQQELTRFCQFVLNRCFLVSVSTDNQQSAFRVFSVMNSRGLDLLPIDIVKSKMIGQIEENQQQRYTDKWEALENQTTRAGFNEVFTHTRMIFAKTKAQRGLLEEFEEHVMERFAPKQLIDKILEPYAEAYTVIKNAEYAAVSHADEVNYLLSWLNRIDNSDWMPPAMKFFAEHQNDSDYVLWFVERLERLAAYLHITAQDLNRRLERYKWVLEEMDRNPQHSLKNPLTAIELTNEEKRSFRNALNGEIYRLTPRRRNYVILRLDSFVSCGGARYDAKILTIEHVLPQIVAAGSQWESLWQDEKYRQNWLNRIANLVPLTRRHNSEAQNFDFEKKKQTYFKGRNGTTSYALTTQVLNTPVWTPAVVEERQKELMELFDHSWRLDMEDDGDTAVMFHLAVRGCTAEGYGGEGDTFVVKKGSRIAPDVTNSIQQTYVELRNQLMADGTIVNHVFARDHAFSSVSTAASVVSGRSANGRKEWTALDGRSYSQFVK